jgi:hypothetical protein
MIILEASEELFGGAFFRRSQPGIDLGYIDGAAGQEVTLCDQAKEELAPAALAIECVNDDAGIQEVGGHLSAESPVQPLLAFLPNFLYPTCRTALEFRVILVLPSSSDVFQSPDLL